MTVKEVSIKHLFKVSLTRHLKFIVRLMDAIENGHRKSSIKSVDRVHDLRTETRRADVGLRLFVDWLPEHAVVKMRKKLSDLRAGAGRVRDLDVLIESLHDAHQPLSADARTWLSKLAAVKRCEAMRSLQRRCRHASNDGFEGRVQSLIHRVGWRKVTPEPDIDEFASHGVRQRAEMLFLKADLLKTDAKQMHKVRIRARQLRYALDSLACALSKSTFTQARQILTQIQEELGKANDELFALEFLQTVVPECDQATTAAEVQQTIQVLADRTADQIRTAIHRALKQIEQLRDVLANGELMPD